MKSGGTIHVIALHNRGDFMAWPEKLPVVRNRMDARVFLREFSRTSHEMRNEIVEELIVDQRAKTEQIEALPS
jgi:hypothetical protein